MTSHDVVQNAFVFIVKDEECVLCEQPMLFHFLPFIFHIKRLTLWF
jgi:hypothetical protein